MRKDFYKQNACFSTQINILNHVWRNFNYYSRADVTAVSHKMYEIQIKF